MKDNIKKIKEEILKNLQEIKSEKYLRDLELKYLGRKGKLTALLRNISLLGTDEKKIIGKLANDTKKELLEKFSKIRQKLTLSEKKNNFIDVTLPGLPINGGHIHPLTQIINDLSDLFLSMGFMILDGPELESDYYNFEALNIPSYHPARDMQDTFYIKSSEKSNKKSDLVMRTHTSPMQARTMQKYGAPLRCVVPGRVFRAEASDATHDSTFYQLECLMIDKNISLSNLIAALKEMLNNIFGREIKMRVRPGYFPFVEPGLEIDINCTICGGKGCPSCKNSGWLEMVGAGMIHPNVLRAGGINPEKYSGFAFGLGLDRLVMMRQNVNDIRLFHSGDLRFLNQF